MRLFILLLIFNALKRVFDIKFVFDAVRFQTVSSCHSVLYHISLEATRGWLAYFLTFKGYPGSACGAVCQRDRIV